MLVIFSHLTKTGIIIDIVYGVNPCNEHHVCIVYGVNPCNEHHVCIGLIALFQGDI